MEQQTAIGGICGQYFYTFNSKRMWCYWKNNYGSPDTWFQHDKINMPNWPSSISSCYVKPVKWSKTCGNYCVRCFGAMLQNHTWNGIGTQFPALVFGQMASFRLRNISHFKPWLLNGIGRSLPIPSTSFGNYKWNYFLVRRDFMKTLNLCLFRCFIMK